MRFYFLLTFLAGNLPVLGQDENKNAHLVATRFEKFYNHEQYDSIFAMFSLQMKEALPIDETKEFFSGLHSQAGNIGQMTFTKYDESYASYKTNFERALFTVNISVDEQSAINGLYVKPFIDETLAKPERNRSKLMLPFKGEWTIIWGGDTKEQNYHVEYPPQKNAFDILMMDNAGKSYKTTGLTNEDYYAFGKELFAPCDATVVLVVDGVKDNKPGEMNPVFTTGNTVILKTSNNEFLVFAHFKQHTIKVTEGQEVKQGTLLGLCGNSGNSSEPHLHFHIQNVENMNIATGIKCFFDKLTVNGVMKSDYSPVKNDKVKP